MGYPYQNANYGDYYQGDLKGLFGGILGVAGKILPGPLGMAAKVAGRVVTGAPKTGTAIVSTRGGGAPSMQIPTVPAPGIAGFAQRLIPGGASGMLPACPQPGMAGYHANKALMRYVMAQCRGKDVQDPRSAPRVVNEMVKNRSLNPTNPRALRRAIRRTAAFVGLARASLKGSGYTIKRTGLPRKAKRAVRKR